MDTVVIRERLPSLTYLRYLRYLTLPYFSSALVATAVSARPHIFTQGTTYLIYLKCQILALQPSCHLKIHPFLSLAYFTSTTSYLHPVRMKDTCEVDITTISDPVDQSLLCHASEKTMCHTVMIWFQQSDVDMS